MCHYEHMILHLSNLHLKVESGLALVSEMCFSAALMSFKDMGVHSVCF